MQGPRWSACYLRRCAFNYVLVTFSGLPLRLHSTTPAWCLASNASKHVRNAGRMTGATGSTGSPRLILSGCTSQWAWTSAFTASERSAARPPSRRLLRSSTRDSQPGVRAPDACRLGW